MQNIKMGILKNILNKTTRSYKEVQMGLTVISPARDGENWNKGLIRAKLNFSGPYIEIKEVEEDEDAAVVIFPKQLGDEYIHQIMDASYKGNIKRIEALSESEERHYGVCDWSWALKIHFTSQDERRKGAYYGGGRLGTRDLVNLLNKNKG